MAADLTLLVLRSSDIELARRFYEALGLRWQEERHELGPKHYSCRLGTTLLEIYPAKDGPTGRVRLGLRVAHPECAAEAAVAVGGGRRHDGRGSSGIVIRDPDGNDVELLASGGHEVADSGANLTYATVHDFVRTYSRRPGDPTAFDANAVIHLMLAALDNLRAEWIDADLDQIALSATREQRQHLIKIGDFLRDHPERAEDRDAG